MPDIRDNEIIEIVKKKISCSSREVFDEISSGISYATVKRIISRLAADNLLSTGKVSILGLLQKHLETYLCSQRLNLLN